MQTSIPACLQVMRNLMGSRTSGIKNFELGKQGSNLVSATKTMSNFWISNHKDYQIYFDYRIYRIYVNIRKDYVLRIFYS